MPRRKKTQPQQPTAPAPETIIRIARGYRWTATLILAEEALPVETLEDLATRLADQWESVLAVVKRRSIGTVLELRACKFVQLEETSDLPRLALEARTVISRDMLRLPERRKLIEDAIEEVLGTRVACNFVTPTAAKTEEAS